MQTARNCRLYGVNKWHQGAWSTGGATAAIGVASTAGTNCAGNQHCDECVTCTGGATAAIGVASTAEKKLYGLKTLTLRVTAADGLNSFLSLRAQIADSVCNVVY